MIDLTKKYRLRWLIFFTSTIISFASIKGLAQSETPSGRKPAMDITDSIHTSYELLKKQFGENKEMPGSFEKQILYALSYFPELAKTEIRFQIKKSKSGIISTRPTVGSIFRTSTRRTYLVIINDSTEGRTRPVFSHCNENGQVGILGHELCHILYFNNSTGLGLLGLGISHVSGSSMDRFEYKTDSMDIERGLGHQLIAWKQCLYKGFNAMRVTDSLPPDKPETHRRYMSIEQVRQAMEKSQVYR